MSRLVRQILAAQRRNVLKCRRGRVTGVAMQSTWDDFAKRLVCLDRLSQSTRNRLKPTMLECCDAMLVEEIAIRHDVCKRTDDRVVAFACVC